ncbi:uncharacterized protein B0T23DRAFT_90144 [Neurospora hispaniola]|uniref:Uncharacterized protein n=1 Tax=Neurospora hispaniola TaxID=588809 RepID=A0AAJ0IDD3_9PEZI|nr:hypothetical protein B0T23DRAFT_90144 [Neurospora hispaniola]
MSSSPRLKQHPQQSQEDVQCLRSCHSRSSAEPEAQDLTSNRPTQLSRRFPGRVRRKIGASRPSPIILATKHYYLLTLFYSFKVSLLSFIARLITSFNTCQTHNRYTAEYLIHLYLLVPHIHPFCSCCASNLWT